MATETKSGSQIVGEAVRTKHVSASSQEDGNPWRPSDPPRQHGTADPKVSTNSPLNFHGNVNSTSTPKRATRQGLRSDRRIDQSPLHSRHQAKVGGKGSGMPSPSSERKGSTERGSNSAPLTPGGSRLRSVTQGNETPEHSGAVPKFGDWNEADPTSADGFTRAFNKVIDEKLNGTGNVSAATFRKSYSKHQKKPEKEMSMKCCCFPR